jgi:hypothetical protein
MAKMRAVEWVRHSGGERVARLRVIAPILVLALSCATTSMTGIWRDPQYSGPPLRKVLVCSMDRDDVTRHQLEDAFTAHLHASGVQAIQSYRVIPPGRPTAEQVRAVAQGEGADGIIVTLPAKVTVVPDFGPGPAWAYGPGWGPFVGAWGADWDYAYGGPGYWGYDTQVSLQTKVYSAREAGRLLWAGTSQTFDPSSIRNLVSQIVPRFIYYMARVGIVPPEYKAPEYKGSHHEAVGRADTLSPEQRPG